MSSRRSEGVMQLDRREILKNQEGGHYQGVDVNINPETMVDLLISLTTGRGDLARTAKNLLREMEGSRWNIAAGVHAGGIGGGGRAPDTRPHITLTVARANYHVRLSNNWDKVVEITGG